VKILSKIPKPESFKGTHWPSCSFIGLYSGHFGNSCVSFLKKNLHKFILNDVFFPSEPKKAIFNGFLKTDSEFLAKAEETCNLSGAFAVVVLIIGKKCFVANTGKSRIFISMKNGTSLVQLSQNHSAENHEESKRIIQNGGQVYKEFVLNHLGQKEEIGNLKVIPGKKDFTRSFGDFDCKVENYGGISGTIIADPHVKSFKISEVCDFLCLTSEGISEEFEDSRIVDCLFKQLPFAHHSNPYSTRLDLLSSELLEKCRGNTSIVVIGLSHINYE
jgi:protein phosphatase 2C family protein 2/3